ncbi:DUF5709 domain-containing protein [Nocardioides marmoraquaticus]
MSQSGMTPDQLQPEDTLEDRGVEDVLDEGYSPPERETDHLKHPEGGETLEERLDDEEPEVWEQAEEARQDGPDDIRDGDVGGEVGEERTGRLIAPDEGTTTDTEKDLVGTDEGIDGAGASAEEAAMHTIED